MGKRTNKNINAAIRAGRTATIDIACEDVRDIRKLYSPDDLARVLTLREDRFGNAFGLTTIRCGSKHSPYSGEDYYHFKDNGGSVLAVAHLDTVVANDRRVPHFRDTAYGPLVVSGALDDRLGAYVILHLLPRLGITCDWLFTVGEESGASTAEGFEASKNYDWLIEFDRTGTDVVMYQYEDADTRAAVRAAGAIPDWGSFSDIAFLEHLGVKAFNWGVGYRGNYHSEAGYAYLNDTFAMVAKYLRFHEQNAGFTMHHDPETEKHYGGSYRETGTVKYKWDAEQGDYVRTGGDYFYDDCPLCGARKGIDWDTLICAACGDCTECAEPAEACICYSPGKYADNRNSTATGKYGGDYTAATSTGWEPAKPRQSSQEALAEAAERLRADEPARAAFLNSFAARQGDTS